MLHHFPPAFPDETLYSILCRLRRELGVGVGTSKNATFEKRLGKSTAGADVNFPIALNLIAQKTDFEWFCPEQIILNNSILPFYQSFNPAEVYADWKQAVLSRPEGLFQGMGLFKDPLRLKACALCISDDIAAKRPPYFRRYHQLLGALSCSVHGVDLMGADFRDRYLLPYVPLADDLERFQAEPKVSHPVLVTLARDLAAIPQLFPQESCPDFLKLLGQCFKAAGIKGGAPRWKPAVKLYLKDALPEIPIHMQRRLSAPDHTTIVHVVQPARCLILIRAMGLEPGAVTNYRPSLLGDHRWPCMNRLCRCYDKSVMTAIESFKERGFHYYITKCPVCGLVILQSGLKWVLTVAITRILDFGEEWNVKFRSVWMDSNFNTRQLLRHLGLRTNPINSALYHAAFLNKLPLDGGGVRRDPVKIAEYLRRKASDQQAAVGMRHYADG